MTFDQALQSLSTFCQHKATRTITIAAVGYAARRPDAVDPTEVDCTCGLFTALQAIKHGLLQEQDEWLEVLAEATALPTRPSLTRL